MMAKNNISKELPIKRLSFTIEHLLKADEIYVLEESKNSFALSEFEGNKLLSFWPTEEIAKNNAKGNWENFTTRKINISEMEVILDVIEDNKWMMDVFPTDSKTGAILTVDEFVENLNKAYKFLEGE